MFGWRRTDFHAVPAVFGERKNDAETFVERWRAHVGSATLMFTRTGENRKVLLRARSMSFAADLQRVVERRSVWR